MRSGGVLSTTGMENVKSAGASLAVKGYAAATNVAIWRARGATRTTAFAQCAKRRRAAVASNVSIAGAQVLGTGIASAVLGIARDAPKRQSQANTTRLKSTASNANLQQSDRQTFIVSV